MLLPTIVLFVAFGIRPAQVGLLPRRLGLGILLVLLGMIVAGASWSLGGPTSTLVSGAQSLLVGLGIFVLSFFVYGLPEELAYRGVILSRLLLWLRNPIYALMLSSVLFVAFHIPSFLEGWASGVPPVFAIVTILTPGPQPTGLVWAYLINRTRSIWPGVIWHTSSSTLGTPFL